MDLLIINNVSQNDLWIPYCITAIHGYRKKINIMHFILDPWFALLISRVLFFFKKKKICIESLCDPGENKFASVWKMTADRSAAFRTTVNKQEWYRNSFKMNKEVLWNVSLISLTNSVSESVLSKFSKDF